MKLATLRNGSRDGQLLVVDRLLQKAVLVPNIAPTLQTALDNWDQVAPQLQKVYEQLNNQKISNVLDFAQLPISSPLPRAYQWADGSAYLNHVELVRKARGAEMPENFWHDPLMYQGGSDTFLGPRDAIPLMDEAWGMDFEAEVAVVTNSVPIGADEKMSRDAICLFMLVNDVSLRNLIPNEMAKGFGFFQSKPSSAFSPVAITPDELGSHWDGNKVHLPLHSYFNCKLFGAPNAGVDMAFSFPRLISHAAKTRELGPGTIIGSGTVSNVDRSKGFSCIAEKRMLETIEHGKPVTSFMKDGDTIKIEMYDEHNRSIFGAIEQKIQLAKRLEKHVDAL